MSFYCRENPKQEITNPKVCELRKRNRNLVSCCNCLGPTQQTTKEVIKDIVKILEEKETTKEDRGFRLKDHRKELNRKYGHFYWG